MTKILAFLKQLPATYYVVTVILAAALSGLALNNAHQRAMGKLEVTVADDVLVNKKLKKADAELTRRLPLLLDSAKAAGQAVARAAAARTVAVLASDTARRGTDAALHAAEDAAQDSASRAALHVIKDSLGVERAKVLAERTASTVLVGKLVADTLALHGLYVVADSLAGVRAGRIAALTAENKEIRRLTPSRAGSWLKTGAVAGIAAEIGCSIAKKRICLPF